MEPQSSVQDLMEAARLIESVLSQQSAERCSAVLAAARDCERMFALHAADVRREALARLKLGEPPSLRRMVGISNLEVPLNKALAWALDERERGAAARSGLLSLARLLDFSQLVDDINAGLALCMHAESSPDSSISTRQPDFLIASPNAAVLIENKVWSAESDPDQYSHYLDLLRRWAGPREARAYLLVRDEGRAKPENWERCISHRELAQALRPLTADANLSFWDRVVYSLIVTDLHPDTNPNRHGEIQRLMDATDSLSNVGAATQLSRLLRWPTIDPTAGGN